MNELPEGWLETSLADVAQWGSGGTPSRTHSEYYGGSIPWIKTGELGQRVITETEETITELGLQNSSAKIFPKGSVAIAMYGATIGKTSVLGIDAATNQACAVAIPETRLATVEYLFRFLESQKAAFVEAGKGGAQPNISQGVIKEWLFPLAPLNEQKRIAEKLEALLTQATSSLEKLNRASELVKRFRQSVLAAAMSGVLTEDWREEKSEQLTWSVMAFGEMVQEMKNGLSPKPNENPPGIPVLRISSVRPFTIFTKEIRYLQLESEKVQSYRLEKDDLLFTHYNGSIEFVGVCALVKLEEAVGLTYPDKLIRVRVKKSMAIPAFIEIAANGPDSRTYLENIAKTSAGQTGISGADLRALKISLPSLPEQLEIVSRVETLFALADQLETRISTARAQLERLTPALLAKAFRGELVPQDPNDEPATLLLERIREAKAQTAPASKTRKASTKRTGTPTGSTPTGNTTPKTRGRPKRTTLEPDEISTTHLTDILKDTGPQSTEALWTTSRLDFVAFFAQLKDEGARGLLREHNTGTQTVLEAVLDSELVVA